MATKSTAAVLDETLDTEVASTEPTPKQLINEGITTVIESLGIDGQKNRYKAMRAIAYQAFVNALNDGTFDELVQDAIAGVDDLPSGWEIERSESAAPVKKTAAKAPAKTAAKAPVKKAPAKTTATPRRRPTR